jgi:sialate O-acetylesterase
LDIDFDRQIASCDLPVGPVPVNIYPNKMKYSDIGTYHIMSWRKIYRLVILTTLFLTFLCSYQSASANVRLPKIFTDSMIVQRDKPIKLWGWAGRDEKVVVKFHNQSKAIKADATGQWSCFLNPESAGGPFELSVTGKNTITLKDILIGDVWLCSGQSNMEFMVNQAQNNIREIQQADYNEIRQYKVQNELSWTEENDFKKDGHWETATSGNVGRFSAVAYYFARSVYEHTHIPIGLINDNWGGTNVETWTSSKTLANNDLFSQTMKVAPPSDFDSVALYQHHVNEKKLKQLQGDLPKPGETKSWKNLAYDDSHWPKMNLPALWRFQSLGNMNGAVWFRKTIALNEVSKYQVTLNLPGITQSDSTFINGILVGHTNNRPQLARVYSVPAGLLKRGNNMISVRVSDSTNTGGFGGNALTMNLVSRDTVISIAGSWLFHVEKVYNLFSIVNPNGYPSLLYNAMIYPIIGLAIKGVIWYQGE